MSRLLCLNQAQVLSLQAQKQAPQAVKGGLIYLVILGIMLNSIALTLLAISIFSKKLSEGVIKAAVKILKLFKIKNIEEKSV